MPISTRIKTHLDDHHISFTVLTHPSAFTSQGAAAVMHLPGRQLAKTVVVRADKDYYLVVLPASYHVHLEQLSQVIGRPVRLASETEFAFLFPDCELGAMPPLGELYGLPVYLDASLTAGNEIVFNAGTHRDALRMNLDDFMRLVKPLTCSFAFKG